MKKIAYAGLKGAYAHLAKCAIFSEKHPEESLRNFAEVFQAVSSGSVDYGVVPIENNIGGPVWETYKLVCEHKELEICAEHFMRISHCLAGLETTTLENTRTVISHPQALAQCSHYLKSMPQKIVQQAASTTTHAAQRILDDWDETQAVICSKQAVTSMGLYVMAEAIENEATNTTRFIVLKRKGTSIDDSFLTTNSMHITSLEFSTQDAPGSLYKALGCFTAENINFLNLRNFLIGTAFKPIKFYLEIEGESQQKHVQRALHSLEKHAYDIAVLGSYTAHAFRSQ